MGNGNGTNGGTVVEITADMDLLCKAKRILAERATDKDQSDYLRKVCRDTLHELNNVIAQLVAESMGS